MQALFFAEKGLDKVKDVCGVGGNSIGKQTFVLRTIDDNSYLALFGTNESMNLAKSQMSGLGNELQDPKRSEIIQKINEENAKEKGTKLPPQSIVFGINESDLGKVRDLVGVGANSLERQSVIIKSADALGEQRKGNYVLIEGSEEAGDLAREVLKELAVEVQGEDKDSVIKKIKSEEESAGEGFGSIFG